MADSVHIKGLDALNKMLQELPVKLEKNILRGALRAGANVVKPVAQSKAAKATGLLASGLKIGTRARGGRVTASLKAGGPHYYLARWVEYGVSAHNISAKKNKWLSFGGIFAKDVAHPGVRPRPFLRPALDAMAGAAVVAVGEYIKNRLATKEGLDTSHITVEGDE